MEQHDAQVRLGRADSQRFSYRVLERRILDLIIEVAPPVVADEVRADVFVAGILGRFGLVFEAVKERLRDFLLEFDSRKLADNSRANVFGKGFVPIVTRIQAPSTVTE